MKEFDEIWNIYCDSFPRDERRNLEQQMIILNNHLYSLNPIYDNKKIVGFYSVWDAETFTFIEHIAIDKKFRRKGWGSKALKEVTHKLDKKIILEVEKPETNEAKKRIKFYKKSGFCLNQYDYEQPAYDKDKQSVPLLIMSYPNKITIDEFKKIKNKLYKMVYNTKTQYKI